jgi:hypothetical protein
LSIFLVEEAEDVVVGAKEYFIFEEFQTVDGADLVFSLVFFALERKQGLCKREKDDDEKEIKCSIHDKIIN